MRTQLARLRAWMLVLGATIVMAGCGNSSMSARADSPDTVTLKRGTFVRQIRATGTTEAVRSATTVAPRLAGQSNNLTLTRLVPGGSKVRAGDVLVEFDRQDQIRTALDRRAEFLDLEQQILRKQAEQAAARATDDTQLKVAEHDVERARFEVEKNQFLASIDAQKNTLAVEQATARLAQLKIVLALKPRSASAEIRMLEIRRDRARRAWRNAEANANLMIAHATFQGLAIVKSTFRGSTMAEIQEGDDVFAGTPVVDVVDPSRMQVRARISQVDGGFVTVGQAAKIQLDAYPDLVFDGRVEQVAPLAAASQLTPKVRTFMALISIVGAHEKLMPDLSAAVDIVVDQQEQVLLLPRDAVTIDGKKAWIQVRGLGRETRQDVTVGAISADQVIVTQGPDEGTPVVRRTAQTR